MAQYTIDSTVAGGLTTTLAGLDDMNLTLDGGTTTTLAGGTTLGTTANLTSDSTVRTDSTVNADSRLALEPVQTASTVDLRPVAVDSCVRLELAPPPATEVSTPYEQCWSWSVLGLELFALTVRGRASTHVRPEHPHPVVIEL